MSNTSDKLMRELISKPSRTVTELAKLLGMARPSVSVVLHGHAELSIEFALKLQEKFGMNASKLLISQLTDKLEETRAKIYGDNNA